MRTSPTRFVLPHHRIHRAALSSLVTAVLVLMLVFPVGAMGVALVEEVVPSLTAYPPGSPRFLAVESPGRLWVTYPESDVVGRLVESAPGVAELTLFALPPGSSPWDIAFSEGRVWFSMRGRARIAMLDPSSGKITEFRVPDPESRPESIAVARGSPVHVWFTQDSNKLGQLVVEFTASQVTPSEPVAAAHIIYLPLIRHDVPAHSFREYTLPQVYGTPRIQDVAVQDRARIWVTVPEASHLFRFSPGTTVFSPVPTGAGSHPWAIAVAPNGTPWFTDYDGSRIGSFSPSTFGFVPWIPLPQPDSGPADLAIQGGYVWFTQHTGHRVGRMHMLSGQFDQASLPAGAAPMGIAADAEGTIWVAARGTHSIVAWRPPYVTP